jgi:hypothetical protein
MSRTLLLAIVACLPCFGQGTRFNPRQDFPPDIFDGRSVDVVKIAPGQFRIQVDNPQTRVLRAHIAAESRVPMHAHRPGVLVAITDVNLRLIAPDGKTQDLHIRAGDTQWLPASTHAEQNLGTAPCEYVFVETKAGPIPYNGSH